MAESNKKRKNGKLVKMSESKKDKVQDLGQSINPLEYSYEQGVKAENVEGRLVRNLYQFLVQVAMEAREEKVLIGDTMEETMDNIQYFTTPTGLTAARFADELYEALHKDVQAGKCVLIEELRKKFAEEMATQTKVQEK